MKKMILAYVYRLDVMNEEQKEIMTFINEDEKEEEKKASDT